MRLACISNASYLQLIFNLQLKSEHVRGVGLEKLSLGTFFMDFFVSTFLYCEHIKTCSKNIIFNKIKNPPVIFCKKNVWTVDSEARVLEMRFCNRKSIF